GIVRQDRTGAHVMSDRRLLAVRDAELVGDRSVLAEDALYRHLEPLARERLAVEHERAVHRCVAEHLPRDVERGLARALRAAEAGDLGGVLAAAAALEQLAVDADCDAVRAQVI